MFSVAQLSAIGLLIDHSLNSDVRTAKDEQNTGKGCCGIRRKTR